MSEGGVAAVAAQTQEARASNDDQGDNSRSLDPATVLAALDDVKDPEIPVVSVVELGIVQSVVVNATEVIVTITRNRCRGIFTIPWNIRATNRRR